MDPRKLTPYFGVTRAGVYPEGEITQQDIIEAAQDYNPEIERCKLTPDHTESGPSIGDVHDFKVDGDVLLARFVKSSVPKEYRKQIRRGQWSDASVTLDKKHRVTGRAYVPRIALCGAGRPAVKGLQPISFAEREAECLKLRMSERQGGDDMPKVMAKDTAPTLTYSESEIQEWRAKAEKLDQVEAKAKDLESKTSEYSQSVAKLKEQNEALMGRLAVLEATSKQREIDARLAQYSQRVPPATLDLIRPLLYSLDNETTLKFSQGGEVKESGQSDVVWAILDQFPETKMFSEAVPQGDTNISSQDDLAAKAYQDVQDRIASGTLAKGQAVNEYRRIMRDGLKTLPAS